MMNKAIYLDYAAATPVREEVFEAMKPYFSVNFGNASSLHRYGRKVKEAIEDARERCAEVLNCSTEEIIFTSGGTESNFLALNGVIESGNIDALIVSQAEHPSVLSVAERLLNNGHDVGFLSVDYEAKYNKEKLQSTLGKNSLVSIIYANNEVGTINPIPEISDIVHQAGSILHTDACQAAGYLSIDVDELGVDLMTINGSKIYGPKGIGLLYIKEGTPFRSPMVGGGQERGFRGGTENVAGIVGFAEALSLIEKEKQNEKERVVKLRDNLISEICKIANVQLLGSATHRLPNNACFMFKGRDTQTLLIKLDEFGICVSVASACSAESSNPSHVLLAMGLSYEESFQSLRFSIGRDNSYNDVEYTIEILNRLLRKE